MGFSAEQQSAFEKLYESAVQMDEDSRLVQIKDEMLDILTQSGESRRKFMHPKAVVPHVKNRAGAKMQWKKIFEKGSKIIKVGVSLKACGPDRAVAIEAAANGDSIKSFVDHCKTSPHYAKFNADSIDGESVGCGHWNQFLACIVDRVEVPKEFQEALCEPGRKHLDPDRLCRSQPALRQLLNHGLEFTVIPKRIELKYPRIPDILQKALNVEHHIGEGDQIYFISVCHARLSLMFCHQSIVRDRSFSFASTIIGNRSS